MIKEKCSSEDGSIKLNQNVDLSTLPPCSRVLLQHIHRANYQMAIWRRADVPVVDAPPPTVHSWTIVDVKLEPRWSKGEFIPQIVADQISDASDSDDSNDDSHLYGDYQYEFEDSDRDEDS